MQIGGITINVPPTAPNYVKNYLGLGEFVRTIDHELKALNVAVVRSWDLKFYALEQGEDLAALFGTPTTFIDYDGRSYDVMVTDFSMKGYPEDQLGNCNMTMEEILPSGFGGGSGGYDTPPI